MVFILPHVYRFPPLGLSGTNTGAVFLSVKVLLCLMLLFAQTVLGGQASWYKLDGKTMANGKPFDSSRMTAASRNYPLGTSVRVTNLQNQKSVVVVITDRGPAKRLHREIDLSRAAFARIADLKLGLIPVKVEYADR